MEQIYDRRVFIHRIDPNDTIISVNEEWLDFALENGAPQLTTEGVIGKSLWDFIAGIEVRHLYLILLKKARQNTSDKLIIPCRCDSAVLWRKMEMDISSDADGNVEFQSRVVRMDFRGTEIAWLSRQGEGVAGRLTMCSICNRVRRGTGGWIDLEEATRQFSLASDNIAPHLEYKVCSACYRTIVRRLFRFVPRLTRHYRSHYGRKTH